MESTTQSKSYFPLGVLLSPFVVPFLLGFSIYSLRHKKTYLGNEEYSSRYSFFRKIYWTLFQFLPQNDVLEVNEYLTQKNSVMAIYIKKFSWEVISLSFLLSMFYRNTYQKARMFKFCVLTNKRPWWSFILSSLEVLEKVPSHKYLKELNYPVICFSDSFSKLKEMSLSSYKTVVFFKLDKSFSWKKGITRIFSSIGVLNVKERLQSILQTELKLNKIFSLLEN